MKCPACSAELPDTAKFCPECGEKIVRKIVCPDCGTEAAPGAKFCAECGHRFAAAPAPKPAEPDPAAVKAAVARVFALFHDKDGNCKNATKADAELVAKAAEGDDARAMFLLAEIYADGCDGFAKDPKAPAEWYRKSAEAGDPWGMSGYAMLLFAGDPDSGLEKDIAAAQAWVTKGCALLAAQGEQTAMNAALLGSALAQAPKPDGDDGPPDLGAAAAVAGILLQAAGDVDPETASAVDRQAVGLAHFVLAMDAMTKKDFDLAHEHLEQGVAFGNKDCKEMLEELEGGGENAADDAGDDVGDDAGDDAGDDDGGADDADEPGGIVMSNCGFETKDGETFAMVLDLQNDGSEETRPLRVRLWYSENGYDDGTISGYVLAEAEATGKTLHPGQSLEKLCFRNCKRIADPSTGDYVATLTVEELDEGGNPDEDDDWVVADACNFDGTFHWNHVGDDDADDDGADDDGAACPEPPKPTLETGLTPEQAEKLKGLCEEARGNAASTVFSIGAEIDVGKLRKFGEAGQSKLGVANLHFSLDVRQAANQILISARTGRPAPGAPIAFFDNTMFGSGKAGLLLTPKGLYSVNGMLGNKVCPSGFLSWADLAGEKATLELFGDCDLQICSSPQVGVNLSTFPAGKVRDILAKFRAFLRGE